MPKRLLSCCLLGFVPNRCLHCGIFSLFASLSFELVFLRSFIFLIMLEPFCLESLVSVQIYYPVCHGRKTFHWHEMLKWQVRSWRFLILANKYSLKIFEEYFEEHQPRSSSRGRDDGAAVVLLYVTYCCWIPWSLRMAGRQFPIESSVPDYRLWG